jgi:hypothetical protein
MHSGKSEPGPAGGRPHLLRLGPRLLKSWPRLEPALVCSFTGFYEYVCYYNAVYMHYVCHYLTVKVNEHTFYVNFNIFLKS